MQDRQGALFRYERKRFFSIKFFIWFGLCFLVSLVLFWTEYREKEKDLLYKEIVERYQGVESPEKIDEIKEKTLYYQQSLADYRENAELYSRDQMSDEDFELFLEDYRHAKKYISGWERLHVKAIQFENCSSTEYFFYDKAWEQLFKNKISIPFILLFITLLVPYFYLDSDANLEAIGNSYCHYQKLKKNRFGLALIFVLAFQILWIIGELLIIVCTSSLPFGGASVCSLSVCDKVSDSVSLIQFYILRNILLLLKRCVDTTLLYMLADKIRHKMQTMVILILYLLATDLFYLELLKRIL